MLKRKAAEHYFGLPSEDHIHLLTDDSTGEVELVNRLTGERIHLPSLKVLWEAIGAKCE